MHNCPDYVAIWLGFTRVGCSVALINTNMMADELLHCIQSVGANHLIVGEGLVPAVENIADRLSNGFQLLTHSDTSGVSWPCLQTAAARFSGVALGAAERPLPKPSERALLIYTSGTTGLPKAVNITHARVAEWSFWFAGMMNVGMTDRLYNCLPMYHSIGGIVAIGSMLVRGGSVVVRERFSATAFWSDVANTGCTIFQYIGELCRYLTLSPPHPLEQHHRLRLACGNGLPADIWEEFQKRFGVARILEFYAATEGVLSLYNCEGKPGAIGRIPPFLARHYLVALIRIDSDTADPARDPAGHCIACEVDEVGEAVRKITDVTASPTNRFDGYTDANASQRKVITGAFSDADRWFRTGDLMRKDASGFFYFVDRIGDTFRWRGENVSTTSVATALRSCPGIIDAVVYGVAVPHNEGRAGMAAIIIDNDFDLVNLLAHLTARLPAYASPLFLRLCKRFEVTGTYKSIKGRLQQEGYANSTDPVWLHNRVAGQFELCDASVLRSIVDGSRRL
jgi:fatty-acyl-CoA synthase